MISIVIKLTNGIEVTCSPPRSSDEEHDSETSQEDREVDYVKRNFASDKGWKGGLSEDVVINQE